MERKRVLIADDDPDQRMIVRTTLTDEGYIVEEASDGDEAAKKLLEETFDLVLLDIVMPGKSGMDILRQLSNQKTRPSVIMLTGRAGFTMATESLMLGAVEYITKPFAPEYMLDVVNGLLNPPPGQKP